MDYSQLILGLIIFIIQLACMILPFIFMMVIMFFVIIGKIFWIGMIIDAAKREFPKQDDKLLWLMIIIFTSFIGALIYFFVGRKAVRRQQDVYSY